MATIDTPIPDKHEPWENYRGNRVEDYIKEQFDKKAGCFYPDNDNNKVLVFADEENRDLYLADPTQYAYLLITTLDIPSMYAAHIELLTPSYVAILTGTTGQYIRFSFSTESRDSGQTIPEDVYCTYTFKRGSHTEVVNARYTSGTTVAMNIDRYLLDGTNNITITITGVNTLASTTFGVVYKVINLALSDNFGIAQTYGASDTIAIPYTIAGSGMKYMEWFIDGALQTHVPQEDEIPDLETTKTKYISFENLASGVHTLQFRAYVLDNEERFHSQILYREFMVVTGEETAPIVAVKGSIADGANGIVPQDERITFDMLTQYVPYELTMAVYNPASSITPVEVSMDSTLLATIEVENYREATYTITPMTDGEHTLTIKAGTTEAEFDMDIAETTMDIREITDALVLDFNASGRTNADRTWSYGQYTGTFTGFKWNETSGYNNNRLIIDGGASFGIDYAPFASSLHSTGMTIEMEYSTMNVSDDDAVLMDLLTDGVGLKLTASEIGLYSNIWKTSADAAKRGLTKRFRSGDNIRITYVVNPYSGVSNHGLVFVYVNGRIGGAKAYTEADSFISSKELLFSGSEEAVVALKQVRIYNTALSPDQVLNNFMLYRDSLAEMQRVYDANDVLEGETTSFDPYKLAETMPVMLVTGNIPALENEYQDKKKQIVVDVEYINMQDPELSFTMTNATMTPQGTSSMAYPKKNFRLYSRKYTYATLLDWQGNEIESGLYSFKKASGTQKAAQPVDTWCFKCDYAESSSSHNTGVARLWNKALYDAKVTFNATDPNHSVSNAYVLRTLAQQAALDNDYEYDVRTCIDGFPICMFYRLTEDSDYIFIGKYNFNNDKSTESVFGFRDVPGFDNSHVECWECLDNSNPIALFKNVTNFDTEFSNAFEARYPDDAGDPSEAARAKGSLKTFCTWLSGYASSTGGSSSFATQKWQHLDVYKVAAYYVYLMSVAAVDQTTKNSMLTTEDGVHFFFINYDNDTINALRNDGILLFLWNINRQSLDPSYSGVTVYAFAGHDNTLWNMLEADTEFMAAVKAVYDALNKSGWNYENLIDMFDNKQSLMWCERVFNQDADYKYLTPYRDAGTDHLEMLQGSRSSHRKWWLSKRLALYDSLFVSGEFRSNIFQFKVANNTPATNLQFTIKAGESLYYGWGINGIDYATGTYIEKDQSHTYTIGRDLAIGDPVSIYAGTYIKEVDIHQFLPYLTNVEMTTVYSEETNVTSLKKLVIGASSGVNSTLTGLSGLASAKKLEYLDIQGCTGITSLNLSENIYITTLKAKRSRVNAIVFASGAYITNLEAPTTLTTLTLEGCPNITEDTISFEDTYGENISTISIRNCAGLAGAWDLWWSWYQNKNVSDADSHVFLDGIDWEGVDAEDLIGFGGIGDLTLRGKILISGSISPEQVAALQSVYGEDCFDSDNDLWIRTETDYVALVGDDSMTEGQTKQYRLVVISSKQGYIKYTISGAGSHMASIDEDTGILITSETGSATDTVTVFGRFYYDGGMIQDYKSVTILKATYPTVDDIAISGPERITMETTNYTRVVTGEFTGVITGSWSLSGDLADIATVTGNNTDCIVTLNDSSVLYADGVLSYSFYKTIGGTTTLIGTVTKNILVFSDDLAVIRSVNGPIMTALWNAYGTGGSQVASRGQKLYHEDYITKTEAASFVGEDLNPTGAATASIFQNQRSSITNFDEFKHFTGVTAIPAYCFVRCTKMASITFPPNLTSIGNYAFATVGDNNAPYVTTGLQGAVALPATVATVGTGAFGGQSFTSFEAAGWIVGELYTFYNCNALQSIRVESMVEMQISSGVSTTFYPTNKSLREIYAPRLSTLGGNYISVFDGTFTVGSLNSTQSSIFQSGSGIAGRMTLRLSKYCTSITKESLGASTSNRINGVKKYEVDPENTNYRVVDDFLIDIAANKILRYPNKEGVCRMLDGYAYEVGFCRQNCMVTGIEFPTQTMELPNYAFFGCSIVELNIQSNITKIGNLCFGTYATSADNATLKRLWIDCPNVNTAQSTFQLQSLIEELHLGSHAGGFTTNAANNRFQHGNLQIITVDDDNPNYRVESGCLIRKSDNSVIYGSTQGGNIPEGVTTIQHHAFRDITGLTEITIPSTCTLIQNYAFDGCLNVETIISKPVTAPTLGAQSFGTASTTTGYNKKEEAEHKLYVPSNSTGYESGQWDTPLCDEASGGFELSKTL